MAKNYKCDICSKKFSNKYNLSNHKHTHTTDTPFNCLQCPYRGKTKKYLARHTKQVHKELKGEHKCDVCGKFFLHPSSLKVHAMVHSGEKPHKCNVCGKSFRVTYSLNSHMLIHTNEKPFACSFCDYACRDSSTLRKHQNKHMGLEKIYECKICNKGYKSRAALKIHIAERHLELDVRKFSCPHCDKMFKSNAHRKTHIEVVHKRSLVCNCPVCGRRLLNKNNLSAHLRTHLEERPFRCTYPGCNVSFKDKNSLTKHKVIHNPAMHFSCVYCGRKFARKSHKKDHERVMHVERNKNLECDFCGSKFYTKNYLIKHIQTKHVHKEAFKYICDVCGLVTHNKPSIVMHLKYGHTNDYDVHCKICDKKIVYKKHSYLKQHYWRMHNIRYKITKKGYNKSRKEKNSVEIKIEPIEADSYEDIQLLEVQKQENEDLVDESLDYSKSVLSEDIATSVLRADTVGTEVAFDDFFIKHVFAKQEIAEDIKTESIDTEQNEHVKRRIKQILKKTEKIEKAKTLQKKREKEEKDRVERERQEAVDKAKREREELEQLRRVRVLYNERMEAALMREREKKDQVKIKYFKKIPESKSIENTEEISEKIEGKRNLVQDNDINELKECEILKSNSIKNNKDIITKDMQKPESENKCIVFNKSIKNNLNRSYSDETKNKPNLTDDTECQEENSNEDKCNENELNKNAKDKEYHLENNIKDTNEEYVQENMDNLEINTCNIEIDINKDTELNIKDTKNNTEIYDIIENTSSEDESLLKRRKRYKRITKKINEKVEVTNKKAKKMEFKTFQCYVCFKLYQTKDELISHCQGHFDICHTRTLSKCPLCEHVSYNGLAKHMRVEHGTELTTLHNTFRDKDGDGSGYNYDINGTIIQVIPSVNALNKNASKNIDKVKRDLKDKVVSKSKLVKKGNEWIVDREIVPIEFDVLPEFNDRELSKLKLSKTDVDRLGQLSYIIKKKGLKMMFPCFHCDKVCQNFSGLKLHQRRHEDNPKPFKPRVKKNEKIIKDTKKVKLDKSNRHALPKPILNKHKCDDKLKEFFESNIRGGDVEFWQFLKIYNRMNKEKVNEFNDLEKRNDFGNHSQYYKDGSDEDDIVE